MMDSRLPHPTTSTLLDALENTARLVPDRGITVFDRRGQNGERRTYGSIPETIQNSAKKLAAAGIGAGDRVLMCLPTSWELIELYLGVIYRGALPVLVAPAGALGGAAAHAHKISGLLELLTPRRFICDDSTRKEIAEFGSAGASAFTITPAEIAALKPMENIAPHRAQPGDVAFLQLTSGSTARQRAVQIKHSNVVHNARAIGVLANAKSFDASEGVVSWLPLNHDMGLVGCFFFSLIQGFELFLLRPDSFLGRPRLWLQTISQNKATMSPAPNFAYQLCIERIEDAEVAGLDLSTWRVAMTGAEMVHPQTCKGFADKFAAQNFNPLSITPSYGMAEATLAATSDLKRQGVRTTPTTGMVDAGLSLSEVVCVGEPVIDTEVRISSPGVPGKFLKDGLIGEVWVRGPGVFGGYYNDREETAESLFESWLRTGDLGFLKNGELYITGRIKELLIIHGHNMMPHELEWVAEGVSGGGGTERCGAFSVTRTGEGEQAVLVIEVGGVSDVQLAEMDREIRARVGRALGLPLSDLVFIKRGQIPKTTSGKVQRRELRQRYLDGRLERLQVPATRPPAASH